MKVTITFEEIPEGMGVPQVKLAMQDAVFEFIGQRSPVEKYVAKRYGHMDLAFRATKLRDVAKRVELLQGAHIEVSDGTGE